MAEDVCIPEYFEDCELTAGEGLAGEAAFWLAHLLLTVGDLAADPERYGVDAAAYEHMVERLGDAGEPWPVLRAPLAGGHTAYVVYATFEDTNDVDFFVRHPDWGRLGFLGQCGAEGAGPGLSWAELTAVAAAPAPAHGAGLTDASQRLLLFLPMLGDAETPDEARGTVAQALVHCGIPSGAAGELAASLLEPAPGGDPRWTVAAGNPVAVCSSPYSPRRIPLALGITPDQAQALAEALAGRG
ncbi:hypothetical protein ACWEN3_06635 [Streptomyces sp. NPDC004561]